MTERFFETPRDTSEIKLRIVERFLTPWSAKLGFRSRRGTQVVWYVDGFAGPGRYDDGRDGSPLLGLERAAQVKREGREYDLRCLFVEKSRTYCAALDDLCRPFRDHGVTATNLRGEFSPLAPRIEAETQDCAILLFLDPFGVSPLKYEAFRVLLSRRAPLDLFLTFHHRATHRLAENHPHLISEAIGGDEWIPRWQETADPIRRVQHVLDVFHGNLIRDGEFLEVSSYPIRSWPGASPSYYLLFASRHIDAFELWNDEVAQEETGLSNKAFGSLTQASFFPAFDQEFKARSLAADIREFGRGRTRTTREKIISHLVVTRSGRYHTKDIKKVVWALIESGEVTREPAGPTPRIDSDVLRFR